MDRKNGLQQPTATAASEEAGRTPSNPRTGAARVAIVAAVATTGLWFWLTWRYGLDLADEGYYWYGAQRVNAGEVPMRDFHAYDIGRYYFSAWLMRLSGQDGLLAARVIAALFQCIGTSVGVWLCIVRFAGARSVQWPLAAVSAALLTIWVWPYYKVFDHATSIFVVASVALMLARPDWRSWLLGGVGIGLAATIGRNHGVYGVGAACIVALLLIVRGTPAAVVARLSPVFVAGCLLGFAPTLLMALWVDGFGQAFVDSILWLFKYGGTNLGRPVPWPWSASTGGLGMLLSTVKWAEGLGFVFVLAVPLFGVAFFLQRRATQIIPAAATAAALPYAHYAFARADIEHLALGIFPALIAVVSFSASAAGWRPLLASGALLAGSIACLGLSQPFLLNQILPQEFEAVQIDGHQILAKPRAAGIVELAGTLRDHDPELLRNFVAVPTMIGLHAIYRQRMSLWGIYATLPRGTAAEQAELQRMAEARPRLIIVSNHPLDQREELRYSRTHPLIYQWIVGHYVEADVDDRLAVRDVQIYLLDRNVELKPADTER